MSTLDAGPAPRVATSPHTARGYRYPGSPPFGDSELDRLVFRGRAVEAKAVLHNILSHDLFVIFGASGRGKTSLLNAGVFESLRARDLWPFVVRVNDPSASPIDLVRSSPLAAAEAEEDIDLAQHPAADGSTPDTLWDLFSALEVWRGNVLERPVMILDQFEELFTLGFPDPVRHDFIVQLGELVRRHRTSDHRTIDVDARRLPDPDLKVVMVLREDSLGELDAMSAQVPQIMRHRFRVRGLQPDQARSAIVDPAATDDPRLRSHRFTYSEAAADLLLEFLRTREVRGETHLAPRVDPSQLQIICQHVERFILPQKTGAAEADDPIEMTPDDLGGTQGLNDILRDFYQREIAALDPEDQPRARALCESGLISRSGRRLSLEEGEIEATWGVSRQLLDELIDRRLLRADPRVGSVYYELAHDTLVTGIQDQSREWLTEEQTLRRAVWLDRWALGLTIPNLVYGWLSGPLLAVSILALRSPPRPRRRQWRAWVGLAVGLVWYAIWATPVLWSRAPSLADYDPYAFQSTDAQVFFFGIFVVQAAIGAAVGLLWPVTAERTSARWKRVLGSMVAALLAMALPSMFTAAQPDSTPPARAVVVEKADPDDLQVVPSRAQSTVVGEAVSDGTVQLQMVEDGLVQHQLRIDERRPIVIDVRGGADVDPVVRIFDGPVLDDATGSEQDPIAADDDGGDGLDARLELALDPGVYTIEVYDAYGSAGDATLDVTPWDAIVVAGDSVSGGSVELDVPSEAAVQQELELVTDSPVAIDVRSTEIDNPVIRVLDGNDIVASNEPDPDGIALFYPSQLVLALDSGSYTIEVLDAEGAGGPATVSVTPVAPIVVEDGSVTTVEVQIPRESTVERVLQVFSEQRVAIAVRGDEGNDPVFSVLQRGFIVGFGDLFEQIELDLLPGLYTIEIRNSADAVGRATIEATGMGDGPARPPDPIPIDTEATGSIMNQWGEDWFVLEHDGGGFEAATSGCDDSDDTVLQLWEEDRATLIDENDNADGRGQCSAIVVPDLEAGTYYLSVWSRYPGDFPVQDYTLTIGGG